jgi:hypothetical protein
MIATHTATGEIAWRGLAVESTLSAKVTVHCGLHAARKFLGHAGNRVPGRASVGFGAGKQMKGRVGWQLDP